MQFKLLYLPVKNSPIQNIFNEYLDYLFILYSFCKEYGKKAINSQNEFINVGQCINLNVYS